MKQRKIRVDWRRVWEDVHKILFITRFAEEVIEKAVERQLKRGGKRK